MVNLSFSEVRKTKNVLCIPCRGRKIPAKRPLPGSVPAKLERFYFITLFR
ncbi:hypothetical protein BACCAP_04778 [Pseudoflavonifractor capillosus ATCC 29799]|uniref:Uncharacterized protein n=1 Tax=Pseudoflavonifractor capillosus ATCC 29799 TaxID=411467 RepID=A6P2P7_9FIRM|nr:hypothetical protein BACCAP_04778 [Pseudoflavonifractor capillosus ATCC 29799]